MIGYYENLIFLIVLGRNNFSEVELLDPNRVSRQGMQLVMSEDNGFSFLHPARE